MGTKLCQKRMQDNGNRGKSQISTASFDRSAQPWSSLKNII